MTQSCPYCSKNLLVCVTAESYYAVQHEYTQAQEAFDKVYHSLRSSLDEASTRASRLEEQNTALQRRIEELEGELCSAASRGTFR